jgi:uroporphyrin-III C-methyltransferase
MSSCGIVYLVGAGPGDPELITVRGLKCLQRADVVVYDRLANRALLDYAPPGAELIDVGKEADRHTLPQAEINRLLVERGRAGKTVVRLKGGDPFVFGRGGEEALALVEAGVPFEVVPGVTSAIAAPAYAGIPVTHRGLAGGVTIVTGHRADAVAEQETEWERLAAAQADGTLVFLMGVGNLPAIVAALRRGGRPADTPVALIANGTCPDQCVVIGTLADIVERAAGVIRPPAVIVVGPVVTLSEKLAWFRCWIAQ